MLMQLIFALMALFMAALAKPVDGCPPAAVSTFLSYITVPGPTVTVCPSVTSISVNGPVTSAISVTSSSSDGNYYWMESGGSTIWIGATPGPSVSLVTAEQPSTITVYATSELPLSSTSTITMTTTLAVTRTMSATVTVPASTSDELTTTIRVTSFVTVKTGTTTITEFPPLPSSSGPFTGPGSLGWNSSMPSTSHTAPGTGTGLSGTGLTGTGLTDTRGHSTGIYNATATLSHVHGNHTTHVHTGTVTGHAEGPSHTHHHGNMTTSHKPAHDTASTVLATANPANVTSSSKHVIFTTIYVTANISSSKDGSSTHVPLPTVNVTSGNFSIPTPFPTFNVTANAMNMQSTMTTSRSISLFWGTYTEGTSNNTLVISPVDSSSTESLTATTSHSISLFWGTYTEGTPSNTLMASSSSKSPQAGEFDHVMSLPTALPAGGTAAHSLPTHPISNVGGGSVSSILPEARYSRTYNITLMSITTSTSAADTPIALTNEWGSFTLN